jgi:hypothetical protein
LVHDRPTFSDVAPQCNLHYQPFVPAWVNESLSADLPIRLGTSGRAPRVR